MRYLRWYVYKDKEIAVLCNDPKYEHEVEYLADLAAKVTYFPMFSDSQIKKENVTISKDFPLEIKGSDRVTGLVLKSGKVLELDGIFCLAQCHCALQTRFRIRD